MLSEANTHDSKLFESLLEADPAMRGSSDAGEVDVLAPPGCHAEQRSLKFGPIVGLIP
jgi:hypothetical protein